MQRASSTVRCRLTHKKRARGTSNYNFEYTNCNKRNQNPPPHYPAYLIYRRLILIFSSHTRLCLPNCLILSGFPTKSRMHLSSLPYVPHAPPPSRPRFDRPNNIWYGIQIIKLLTMQYPPIPCYLVPLRPSIFLSALFSNTLSLCSSLNVKDQVSNPYKRALHKICDLND